MPVAELEHRRRDRTEDRTMSNLLQNNGNSQAKSSFKRQFKSAPKITRPYREPIVFLRDQIRGGVPCPQENDGVHDWMLKHASMGAALNLSFEDVYGVIREFSNRTDDNPRYRYAHKGGQRTCRDELWEYWEAYAHKIPKTMAPRASGSAIPSSSHIGTNVPFHSRKEGTWVLHRTETADEVWNFKKDPPINRERQIQLYLAARFRPEDSVPIKFARESQPRVRPRDEWTKHPHWLIKRGRAGFEGVWTTANTALGAREEHVLRWNAVVCEDDNSPMEKQWEIYLKSGLPIQTITWSAGKSLHAIVEIGDCQDGWEYRGKAEAIYRHLESLGLKMDWGCRNPNRLTRLGGALRNGKTQTLLWVGDVSDLDFQNDFTFTTEGRTNE